MRSVVPDCARQFLRRLAWVAPRSTGVSAHEFAQIDGGLELARAAIDRHRLAARLNRVG
jgi:hypothetical protein